VINIGLGMLTLLLWKRSCIDLLKKIDTSFHQPLPNMVQRLFADVINDAIWVMNIHEQNHPWQTEGISIHASTCSLFELLGN
jgi:hypothetical protein